MTFVKTVNHDGLATVMLSRGKVNALNDAVVEQILSELKALENDPEVKAIILTGKGAFFSFGFDLPELLSYSADRLLSFLQKFTDLYKYMFLYPKPIVGALNGHAIAGGCMLALTCDQRIMVSGKSKISLNEITFGASVFAGSVEMLRFCVGDNNSTKILYTGKLYNADEAKGMELVNESVSSDSLNGAASRAALELCEKDPGAFAGIKSLLRKPVVDRFIHREKRCINEFLEIWYSESTQAQLKEIKIY